MNDNHNDSTRQQGSIASDFVVPVEMKPMPRPGSPTKESPLASDAANAPLADSGIFAEPSIKRDGESANNAYIIVPVEMKPMPRPEPPLRENFTTSDTVNALTLENSTASGLAASPVLNVFKWWGLFTAALFILLFGVFIFFQFIQVMASIATFPPWAQYAVCVPIGLCVIVASFIFFMMIKTWWRLKTAPQIDLDALVKLDERSGARDLSQNNSGQARETVAKHMSSFPLDDRSELLQRGFNDDEIRELSEKKKYLDEAEIGNEQWLKYFRDHFQTVLDKAAERTIANHAKGASFATMASPLPLLDAYIVLGAAANMTRQLCLIHNLSPGRIGGWIILVRVIRNTFFAGLVVDVSKKLTEEALKLFPEGESIFDVFGSIFGVVLPRAISAVIPKATEGLVNYLFMRRLGKTASSMLKIIK